MDDSTTLGGSQQGFPATSWTLVVSVGSRPHMEQLCRAYWRPVYWYVRSRWSQSNEDAKDLTQGFFVDLMERDALLKATPQRGRFRSFLRASLENFLRNQARNKRSLKRGGAERFVPLNRAALELPNVASAGNEPDFDALWADHILESAAQGVLERLRRLADHDSARVFEAYFLSQGTQSVSAIAREIGLSESAARRALERGRLALVTMVRTKLRETLVRAEDVDQELRLLFRDALNR